MRIHPPELTTKDGLVTLSARVSLDRGEQQIPDQLWFMIPQRYEHLFSRAIEPFVVALSSLASAWNEEITFDGPFSERLSVGLDEYWKVLSSWAPKKFNPIRLKCEQLISESSSSGAAAATFSGGVDSFFTQFMNRNRPVGFRTKYAVFVHGFDIPLKDYDIYESAAARYEVLLAEMGVELIRLKTNARAFIPDWELGHGSALCATGLALGSGISRFLVSSSRTYTTLQPWGSDPVIDGLLSTDQTQMIHDGAFYTRFDKLGLMKDWAPLQSLVRICYEKPDAFHNCGECAKCRRTMLLLESLGALESFPTFPRARAPYHYLSCHFESAHERLCGRQAIAHAVRNGRTGLAWAGRIAMQRTKVKTILKHARVRTRAFRRPFSPKGKLDPAARPLGPSRR